MKGRGFDFKNSTGLGETETPHLEITHKVLGKTQLSNERLGLLVLGVFCGGRGQQWLPSGTKSLAAVVLGRTYWREPSWRLPLSHQDLAACRLQCWYASDQTTNREETQPYPSADRPLKVFL